MKRGDIFHDGFIGYWILHEKPKGRKLFVAPLDKLNQEQKNENCDFWHDPKTWNLENVKIVCNLYDNPEQAAALVNDGKSLKEKILSTFSKQG